MEYYKIIILKDGRECVLRNGTEADGEAALTDACIECARKAGYVQLELTAVAENEHALALYRSEGFVEYGRNPLGFRSRYTGWQDIVHMRLEL